MAASIDLVLEAGPAIWTARHRIDRVAIFRDSGSRVSNAAVVEISVGIVLAMEASVATVLAEEDLAAPVIASAVEHSAAVAVLVDSAAAEADAEINAWNPSLYFLRTKSETKAVKGEHMKNLIKLTSIITIVAVLTLITACQTTTSTTAQNETLLTQSGFKTVAVTTPKQQQAVSKLPQGTVSAVKYQGKTYYVYPTAAKDKIYVGKQAHVNAAQKAVAAQQAQAAQNNMNPAPTMTFQGHGQHGVVAEEFDGFGPMGVNSLGDW